jgi:aspartate racemase
LGGMGPDATANFYLLLVRLFQKKRKAKLPSDFPEMIIESIPMPCVCKTKSEKIVKAELARGCRLLESADADFIVIPCNTVHKYIGEMRCSVSIPVYSIVEETIKAAKKSRITSAAVLGADKAFQEKLYEKGLSEAGITLIPAEEQQVVISRAASNLMKGKFLAADKRNLLKAIKALKRKGAKGIILGCTEFSLILSQKDIPLPVFDSSEILALAAFGHAVK